MKRATQLLLFFIASGVLASCEEGPSQDDAATRSSKTEVAQPKAPEAAFSPLVRYAQDPHMNVTMSGDAVLLNYFCRTLSGQPCDDQSMARLALWGFSEGKTVVDLANAATLSAAIPTATDSATLVSDEKFVASAYRTVLGREPDHAGNKNNLALLEANKNRIQVLLGLIQSDEFKARPY